MIALDALARMTAASLRVEPYVFHRSPFPSVLRLTPFPSPFTLAQCRQQWTLERRGHGAVGYVAAWYRTTRRRHHSVLLTRPLLPCVSR